MKLNEELITHTAKLARLRLSKAEIERFQADLKDVLDAFAKLDKVDTKNVKSSFHPIKLKNVMREDTPKECLSNEEALANTLHKKDGYFKGPRVI